MRCTLDFHEQSWRPVPRRPRRDQNSDRASDAPLRCCRADDSETKHIAVPFRQGLILWHFLGAGGRQEMWGVVVVNLIAIKIN